VNQTGDLASLSFLPRSQLDQLPTLLKLRDALYSATFRAFLRSVTRCGPLSGTKQDMSVNSYTQSCHLLTHDDVIGTRRLSYILYLCDQPWRTEWGGALELYPINGHSEPESVPQKSIPPRWNQFVFFEVQPGRSFHSVEEVVVDGDGTERLSISGWFHSPQEGEEDYVPPSQDALPKSSREQLASTSTVFIHYPESDQPPLPDNPLSAEHSSYLKQFLNPIYLQPRTMKALASRFADESNIELHSFLCDTLAAELNSTLREADAKDGLGPSRNGLIPSHHAGTTGPWSIKGPPHKWRYCTLRPTCPEDDITRRLQDNLFTSDAFRAWLAIVSSLLPMAYAVEARRFRPALDYTLATSEEKEARLDVVLELTPPTDSDDTWQTGKWGGFECYMAPHDDDDDDPAVYRSGYSKKAKKPADDDEDIDMEDEDDSTLLTVQASFNRLLLVLRDERVMHFVKYVSAAAEGSRWDICAEYEVGMLEEDDG
jgi:hypothetical protein